MHVRIVIGINLLIFIQIKLHIRDCDIFGTNTDFLHGGPRGNVVFEQKVRSLADFVIKWTLGNFRNSYTNVSKNGIGCLQYWR